MGRRFPVPSCDILQGAIQGLGWLLAAVERQSLAGPGRDNAIREEADAAARRHSRWRCRENQHPGAIGARPRVGGECEPDLVDPVLHR